MGTQPKPKMRASTTITRHRCGDAFDGLKRLYSVDEIPVAKGAFGYVYNARSLYDDDTLFAIKHLNIRNMTPRKVNEISMEVQILNSLDHPNIVKYYEIYEDKDSLYIVMEN